jgi:hypothetical protein
VKSLWFLPLTFIAGIHGFALFAPYLAVSVAIPPLLRRLRKARLPQTLEFDDLQLAMEQSFIGTTGVGK